MFPTSLANELLYFETQHVESHLGYFIKPPGTSPAGSPFSGARRIADTVRSAAAVGDSGPRAIGLIFWTGDLGRLLMGVVCGHTLSVEANRLQWADLGPASFKAMTYVPARQNLMGLDRSGYVWEREALSTGGWGEASRGYASFQTLTYAEAIDSEGRRQGYLWATDSDGAMWRSPIAAAGALSWQRWETTTVASGEPSRPFVSLAFSTWDAGPATAGCLYAGYLYAVTTPGANGQSRLMRLVGTEWQGVHWIAYPDILLSFPAA